MSSIDPAELIALDRLAPALVKATEDDRWRGCAAELVVGGKSNLTFILRSDAGELVLRRPPTGELLPSAHDMAREARVQRGLAGTAVPVPRVVLADQGDLIGVPFYVMEKVPGHVVRDRLPDGWARTPGERRAMAFALADT
ncbi:phosphotransferase, partial [Nonomuraea sp. MCN248]